MYIFKIISRKYSFNDLKKMSFHYIYKFINWKKQKPAIIKYTWNKNSVVL